MWEQAQVCPGVATPLIDTVCLYVWFSWDNPVNEEIPIAQLRVNGIKELSSTNGLMSLLKNAKENLLNF